MSFQNAMKLVIRQDGTHDGLKVVRVLNNCAYITNGIHMIKRAVQNIPDGFYDTDLRGSVVPTKRSYGLGSHLPYKSMYSGSHRDENFYLDVSLYEPNWEKSESLAILPSALLRDMMQLCHKAAEVDGDIIMAKDGLYIKQNPAWCIKHGFNVRFTMEFDAKSMLILLTEAVASLNEDGVVYLLQEYKADHEDKPRTPLIIGKDRGTYCLLKPDSY